MSGATGDCPNVTDDDRYEKGESMLDTLRYAKRMKGAGIPPKQADGIANPWFDQAFEISEYKVMHWVRSCKSIGRVVIL
jgi:hypothetical protein